MNFDEAAAEWVRQHYPAGGLVVGSVEFEPDVFAYGGEVDRSIDVTYRCMVPRRLGRFAGVQRYGELIEKEYAYSLPENMSLTQLISEIVDIAVGGTDAPKLPEDAS